VIQVQILNGRMAGHRCETRHFPFRIGRSGDANLSLEDDGVWDVHFTLHLEAGRGVILQASPEAFTTVNGERATESVLRNGDVVEAGSVKMRIGLSAVSQYSLRPREVLTWLALGLLCLGQVALVYWLIESV
jgi:predicted component of type VI protein secretion system